MTKARSSDYFLALGLAFLLVAFILYPLFLTFVESLRVEGRFSLVRYFSFVDLESPSNREALLNSIVLSVLSVFFSAFVGTSLAYLVAEFDFPLRGLLRRVAVLPIALPPLVGVVAFLFLYSESGILPRALKEFLGLSSAPLYLEGFIGILFVHVYSFYVYFYLFVSSLLVRIDPAVIEAAENLGSSRWRTVRLIVLPEIRPALLAAALLTFMASMASFSAPFLFAGEGRYMTLQIYNAKINGDLGLAATHSGVLVIFSIFFLILFRRSSLRNRYTIATRGVSRRSPRSMTKASRWLAFLGATCAVLFITLPILTIVLISFAKEGTWTWQLLPAAYTFENYSKLFMDRDVFRPISNSLLMSMISTASVLVTGVAIAFLTSRRKFVVGALSGMLNVVSVVPFAIPGTVIALSLIIAFNKPHWFTLGQVLVGTFWMLPLAYFVRDLPIVVRSSEAGFGHIDRSLEEASLNLGASTARTFRRVTLPLILPSILSGALLAFIAALGEFVSSVLLYTYDSRPISVEILAQLRLHNFGSAAAYGVFLMLLVLLVTSLSARWRGERATEHTFVF